MDLNLNHFQLWVILFLNLNITTVLAAITNVTIDDRNPAIIYSPPGQWFQSASSPLDFGGFHTLTQDPNATASFNFTGIAIYYLSPLWPYAVNTAISLDSGPSTLVNLTDPNSPNLGQGSETVQSQVVWSATGLNNTQHNLLMFVGVGQPYAIVDGLMYTTNTSNTTNISSSTSSSLSSSSTSQVPIITSSTASATSASTLISSPKSKSPSVAAVALGSLFGILGLLIILCAVWYSVRRRKRPVSEAWTVASVPYILSGPNDTNKNGNWTPHQLYNDGYTMTQSNDGNSWLNPRYRNVGMPAPPIPTQSSYYGGYQNDSSSHTDMHQLQMTGRIPNRYEPGSALSTITERSTPQMGEGRTPLSSPASHHADLGYNTAQGSDTSYSISRQQLPSSLGSSQRAPSPSTQGYPSSRRKPVDRKPPGSGI